ncbi:MAG: Guanidinium exporter [Petrimonas sp.]|jgi:quaternary ammonium compound-resistance protein SugE
MMNWIFLIVGGLFEAIFAFSLERMSASTGKTAVMWFLSFLISVSISMFLLFKAISGENAVAVGTGYAVWGGIGAVFTVLAGILFLGESTAFWRIFFLCTLVLSVIGLNLVGKH